MKKKILTAILFAITANAQPNSDYIGLSIGNAQLNAKVNASVESQYLSEKGGVDETHYSFTLGHYYENKGKFYASFNFVPPKDSVDTSNCLSLGYDFLFPLGSSDFSLFAGPVLGYTWHEESQADLSVNLSGLHYGAQAGAIARVTETIDVEAGYRYLIETGKDAITINNIDIEAEAQNLKLWYLGVNFRF